MPGLLIVKDWIDAPNLHWFGAWVVVVIDNLSPSIKGWFGILI